MKCAFPILETSAKSVQTTAEVCADYTCSLYRLQLKSPESTTYLLKCLRALTETNTTYSFSTYTYCTCSLGCVGFLLYYINIRTFVDL